MAYPAVAASLNATDYLGIFKPRIAVMIALIAVGGAAIDRWLAGSLL